MAKNRFEMELSASHKDLKETRARHLSIEAEEAQNDIIRDLEKRIREKEAKIYDLTDLAPGSTTSLLFKKFDGPQWASELQKEKVEKALLEAELKIAENTFKEFFTPVEDGE